MAGYILTLTVILRLALPWLSDLPTVRELMPVPPASLYPMIIAFIAVFNGALLGGTLSGFALLDEREDGTMTALLVTPLPAQAYLTYRATMPAILAFAVLVVQLSILNGLAPLAWWQILVVAAAGATTAPLTSLFFAGFAENKVQGFALVKFTGIGGFIIGASWFVAAPVQYLFGIFPPFWFARAYWMLLEGTAGWWVALLIGLVLHGLVGYALMRRFTRSLHAGA
jgi:fluoroquinolone transport system permease protein